MTHPVQCRRLVRGEALRNLAHGLRSSPLLTWPRGAKTLLVGAALCALALGLNGCALLNKSEAGSQVDSHGASAGAGGTAPAFVLAPSAVSSAGTPGDSSPDAVAAPVCDSLAGLGQCGNTTISADIRTVNLLLVIDKSGSMTDQPAGFGVSKWAAV